MKELTDKIRALKEARHATILAHNYQLGEVQDVADFVGDSLELSQQAARVESEVIVFCGVDFMAETAAILCPEKTVILPVAHASCPMANMITADQLRARKAELPGVPVVCYVNTTAEVKAESDICCTSANAVQVVQNVKADKIIFAPDRNLASWVQRFTDKQIIPWDGFCYVHDQFTVEEVETARAKHPDGVIVAHPECPKEVVDLADEVFSTSGMVKFAKESNAKKFILGTEAGMLDRLKRENPDKTFFALGSVKVCRGMKTTRLEDLHQALENNQHQIELDPVIMNRARKSLERMLEYV